MARVTQPTEYPPKYEESFEAIKKQMLKISKIKRKYSIAEIEVKIKQALIEKAEDKIEYSLRGEIRRGRPKKMGMGEEEFEKEWRVKMKSRLMKDGFPFKLSAEDKKMLEAMRAKERKESLEEASKIASEAMKGIFSSIK